MPALAVASPPALPPFANGPDAQVFRFRYDGPPALLHDYLLARYRYGRSEGWAQSFYPHRVRLNGAPVQPETIVQPGDEIAYLHLRGDEPSAPPLQAPLHEDPWLLAIAKPDSVPVTPSGVYYFTTLVVQAREQLGQAELTPIHRLDLETSGPVLFARRKADLPPWHELFRRKTLRKRYRALAWGAFPIDLREIAGRIVPDDRSRIETRLRLEPASPQSPGAPAQGGGAERSLTRVLAVTHHPVAGHGTLSEVVLEPVTGKTNQLRVHLAHVGHPIVGDKKYHPDEEVFLDWHAHRDFARLAHRLLLPRQALHCEALSFVHPFSGAPLEIGAPAGMWRTKLGPLAAALGEASQPSA